MDEKQSTKETPSITRVARPQAAATALFTSIVVSTLENGDAVSVPLNGDPYELTRSRKVGLCGAAAKKRNVRVRTARSADGLSLLIWMESKVKP